MDKIKKRKSKSKNYDIIKLWISHKRNELIIPYHEKCITNCYTSKMIKNKEIKNEHTDRNNVFNSYLLTIEGRKSQVKYRRKNNQDQNVNTNKNVIYLAQDEQNTYTSKKSSFDKKIFMSNDTNYYDDKEKFHNNITNKRRCVSLNNINEPKNIIRYLLPMTLD
nr:conserved Plasmodium protein, unknown function [Plasmodium sp. DRC-Itaito]